jgi:hypothetical protein
VQNHTSGRLCIWNLFWDVDDACSGRLLDRGELGLAKWDPVSAAMSGLDSSVETLFMKNFFILTGMRFVVFICVRLRFSLARIHIHRLCLI